MRVILILLLLLVVSLDVSKNNKYIQAEKMKTSKTILIIIALVAITATDAFSQVQGRFRVGLDVGGLPHIERGFGAVYSADINLGYNIRDNMTIGIRGGYTNRRHLNSSGMISNNLNILGTYTYFFGSLGRIAPFVGGGFGFYYFNTRVNDWLRNSHGREYYPNHYDILVSSGFRQFNQIGGFLTTGVELGRFRIAAQYNLIPASNINVNWRGTYAGHPIDATENIRFRNDYFKLTVGFFIGGGSRRVERLVRENGELRREIEALVQERMREMRIEEVVREREIGENVESTPTQPVIEVVSEIQEIQEIQEVQNVQIAETVHQPEIPVITAAHDVIVLRNGNIINAHVSEITLTEIRYRAAENPLGPIITLAKRDVFSIDFANGTRQIISAPARQGRPQHGSFQQGDFAVGAHLAILTHREIPTTVGFGTRLQYNITDPLRLEGRFTYFSRTERYMGVSGTAYIWVLGMNMHYLFAVTENVTLYPLAGFSVLGGGLRASAGGQTIRQSAGTAFAFNLGGGVDIKLNNRFSINVEPAVMFDVDSGVISFIFIPSVGIMFRF